MAPSLYWVRAVLDSDKHLGLWKDMWIFRDGEIAFCLSPIL